MNTNDAPSRAELLDLKNRLERMLAEPAWLTFYAQEREVRTFRWLTNMALRDSDGPRMAETLAARGEAGPARAEGIAKPNAEGAPHGQRSTED